MFEFGEVMNRQHTKQLEAVKNWNGEFARADIHVKVNSILRRSLIQRKSFLKLQACHR
ncbi:Ger(x)C family spore germination C-terminal domain-containing protein [Bacillus sp. AFS076308]|uniref:Ger(x)C family spore germination C-terminal domain-containing protein n=1 Tax=unclassified Bacillus (in: firmicutes) TaxID=185979 RepID=UPI0034D2C3BD